MTVNMNTPNSRMIIELLMKNAAKYKDNTEPSDKVNIKKKTNKDKFAIGIKTFAAAEEMVQDLKRKNTIKGVRIKKKRKIYGNNVDDSSDLNMKNMKEEPKTEGFDHTEYKIPVIDCDKIKSEYTEIETKNIKDEESDSEDESKYKSSDESFIMKLLKKNIARYEESAENKTEITVHGSVKESKKENTKVKSEAMLSPVNVFMHQKETFVGIDNAERKREEPSTITSMDSNSAKVASEDRSKEKARLGINKIRTTKAGLVRIKWTKEEDEFLQEAIDQSEAEINLLELSFKLKRNIESVKSRVQTLTKRYLSRGHRPFTFMEDQLLIDIALQQWDQYPDCPFEQLRLRWINFVEDQLHRPASSCWQRWDVHLKSWILQHFSGTLNLDIRRMLANYVADSFKDVDSVNWTLVANNSQFAGHSTVSLRFLFFNSLYRGAKKGITADRKVTLQDVAFYANGKYKEEIKLKKLKILSRQKRVIDYFENCLKEQGKVELKLYSE